MNYILFKFSPWCGNDPVEEYSIAFIGEEPELKLIKEHFAKIHEMNQRD